MRYIVGLMCTCALGLLTLRGCSGDPTGVGGNGGFGGGGFGGVQPTEVETLLATLEAANRGNQAQAKAAIDAWLRYEDAATDIMEFCLNEGPLCWYQGPVRFFGAFYAKLPSFAGADMEKSESHFNIAIETQPNFFATRADRRGQASPRRPVNHSLTEPRR